jgi:hypothetical protein
MMGDDRLNEIIDTLKPYSVLIGSAIVAIKQMAKQFEPVMQEIATAFQTFVKENAHVFEAIRKYMEQAPTWQKRQKQNVVLMAQSGWFPNWFTFFYHPKEEVADVDTLMTMHLNDCWGDLTAKIMKLCPNREHIFRAAFRLHEEGNYIASIPLFISQADGIFCEEIKSFLFMGDKPQKALEKMLETGELQRGFFQDIFLEPYMVKTQFSAGMSKASAKCKKKAPNRHGIMHGYREHLDYGTELNSLKSFSLLAFVVFSVKDIFKSGSSTALKSGQNALVFQPFPKKLDKKDDRRNTG